jgi:hypothetical protein
MGSRRGNVNLLNLQRLTSTPADGSLALDGLSSGIGHGLQGCLSGSTEMMADKKLGKPVRALLSWPWIQKLVIRSSDAYAAIMGLHHHRLKVQPPGGPPSIICCWMKMVCNARRCNLEGRLHQSFGKVER